jgi:hypothetical protein
MVFARIDNSAQGRPRNVILLSDETASRDKTLAYDTDVAEGSKLEILSVRVELTTDIAATARRIQLEVQDSAADVVRQFEFIPTFSTASNSNVWEAAPGQVERTGADADHVTLPPDFFLLPGQSLLISEADNQDASDTMVVHVLGRLA